jgi:Tol biopolymer transport system component
MKISSSGIGTVASAIASASGGHLLARGGKITQITDDGDRYQRPQWHPDGNQLIFFSDKTTDPVRDPVSKYAIWKINVNTSELTQITSPGPGKSHKFPAVSHDGNKIAYNSDQDGDYNIYTSDINGDNPTQLTADAAADVDAAWSPDDSKIVFRSSRDSYSSGHPDPTKAGAVGNPEIYVMDAADGGTQTRITTDDHKNYRPSFSPDGNKIIFDRELNTESDGNKSDIWIMDYPGGGTQTRLTESLEGDSQVVISPDGTKIAWGSGRALDDGGKYEIYVMNIDGSGVTRMTANIDTDYQMDWSPDGTQIAFSSDRAGNYNIFIMDVIYGRLN